MDQNAPAVVSTADTGGRKPSGTAPGRIRASELRNPGLDLLRGIAIASVVFCHATSRFTSSGDYSFFQLGGKGVELFFVLSGCLLGRQLLRELQATGRIDLRRFWLRRWLRTLPAYYAMLAFTYGWQIAKGNPHLDWTYLFFGQTYLSNLPYFGISWSLCVEEHFYLLVAPILWAISRWPGLRLTVPFLLAAPAGFRALGWYGHDVETHVRYDPCAAGVLLAAIDIGYPRVWKWLRRAAPVLALLGLAAVARDLVCRMNPQWGLIDLGPGVYVFIFSSWVLLAAAFPNWPGARHPAVRYLADRSYAAYLTHVEALVVVGRLGEMPFGLKLLLTWIFTLALSEILYRCVERPGMQLRERFRASKSRHAANG